jgi:RNA polymerase sigma-70 factor (ECF subfamily)
MTTGSQIGHLTRQLLETIKKATRLTWVRGADAEDLAQEAALRLLASDPDIRISSSAEAYARRTVRNLAIDGVRRVASQGGILTAFDNLSEALAPSVGPDQESALLLKQVILGLPPIYRDTFVLNRFIGLTYAEIAQRQGITVKAVEYRMSRALALCAEALRD